MSVGDSDRVGSWRCRVGGWRYCRKPCIIIHLRLIFVKKIGPFLPRNGTVTQIPINDLKGLLPEQLRQVATDLGEPAYRGDQLFSWLHTHQVSDLGKMTNLPGHFRQALTDAGARIGSLQLLEKSASTTGQAVKFLFDMGDGAGQVEAVLIVDGDRRTACLSSQVGCPLDCKFCATAKMGYIRNLSAGQMIEQLHQLSAEAQVRGERLTNIVMMGMGEPLLNYESVIRALHLARAAEGGLGIGGRKMTLSTAGHVPGILKLADEDLNVGLAISLNATVDETRSQIMPINRRWPIAELLDAASVFFEKKGRRVTFEYVLMSGVTDTVEDASRLAALTKSIPCTINLIPYNELSPELTESEVRFRRPSNKRIDHFSKRLRRDTTHTVTLRDSRGRDIDAACGQLHRRVEQEGQSRPDPASPLSTGD